MSESERKFEMSRAVTKDKINIREHSVIRCTAVMIAAAVISMSTVLGKPSPFAASFAAAMSGIDCISAFVGSVAGYILGRLWLCGEFSHIIYRKRGDELHHSFGHGRRRCGCRFTLVTACRKA